MKLKLFILSLFLLILSACQTPVKYLDVTEYGVRFRKLPPLLGGGVSSGVGRPGEMMVIWPWDEVYVFDTAVQDISWGVVGAHSTQSSQSGAFGGVSQAARSQQTGDFGYVNTRALDGNEVALAITVRFKISNDPEKLVYLVQNVAESNEEVRDLVVAAARADIRTYMNELRTSDFLNVDERYKAINKVTASLQKRLGDYGIDVQAVNLNDFRFERVLADGSVDTSYQDRLKEIQKLGEDAQREMQRIETVEAKKQQELNDAQAIYNRQVAEAKGYLEQAKLRGDAYFSSRENEAKGIRTRGEAQVKGLIEQINALNGPGGEAILKLDLAKSLMRTDPKFIIMDSGAGAQGLDVKRVDTNQLLNQLGLMEALAPDKKQDTQQVAKETEKQDSTQGGN